MKVLLPELHADGHRLVYLRVVADWCWRNGHHPVIAVPNSVAAHPDFLLHSEGVFEKTRIVPWDGSVENLVGLSRECSADRVVILGGDTLLSGLMVRASDFDCALRVLIMRDWRGSGPRSARARSWIKRAVAGVAGFRSNLDVLWLRQLGDHVDQSASVYDPFIPSTRTPDPGELLAYAEQLGLAKDRLWFSLTGALSAYKNPRLVADSIARLKLSDCSERSYGLLLAGPIPDSSAHEVERIVADLSRVDVPVVRDNRTFTNDEVNVAVAISDVVVTAYSVPYPNSTLIKARVLGKPVALAGSSYIRRRAQELPGVYSGALSVDGLSRAMCLAASARASEVEPLPEPTTDAFAHAMTGLR